MIYFQVATTFFFKVTTEIRNKSTGLNPGNKNNRSLRYVKSLIIMKKEIRYP